MLKPLPGAEPFSGELTRRLEKAVRSKEAGWVPRTAHLEDGRPSFTNRLALEKSPYLLQHAHNPVSWWPWGKEAFEEARRTGRPVFLSIGYATCHWCHVMERESFEDLEVARRLNEKYIPVKVDREERPDLDGVYMTAVQLITGGGGWPMSVWLTPDREPFYAGTYFPPRDVRGGPRGLAGILDEIAALWATEREKVTSATRSLVEAVRTALAPAQAAPDERLPGSEVIEKAVEYVRRAFDPLHGGIGQAPKFPSSLPVRLLLRHHRRARDERSLAMATLTLEKMAAGGLFDQLGGGFHRYSTDERWLVPHFEKMLYDNALLALAYLEAFQVTGRRDFARVARQTLDYLTREMTSPEGGFYAATDADTQGEEGLFFLWTVKEVKSVLGAEAGPFLAFYGVTEEGNYKGGKNVLHVPEPNEETVLALSSSREKLFLTRERRPRPSRDETLLAGWNGLAISALSMGGRVLDEPAWVKAARRAAEFVLGHMVKDGRLRRSFRGGAGGPAFLDDHAFFLQGLLDLHEATFDPSYLESAVELARQTDELFGDPEGGGWFDTAKDHEVLFAREKASHDGAEPSGPSVMLLDALRLQAFTTDARYRRMADGALRHYARALEEQPASLTEMLLAVDFVTDAPREVVLVWPEGQSAPDDFLGALRRTFLPNRALTGASEGADLARLGRTALVADAKVAIGRPTAYVCEHGQCRLPAISADKLASEIAPVRPYR